MIRGSSYRTAIAECRSLQEASAGFLYVFLECMVFFYSSETGYEVNSEAMGRRGRCCRDGYFLVSGDGTSKPLSHQAVLSSRRPHLDLALLEQGS
jgi:hypothetical protein